MVRTLTAIVTDCGHLRVLKSIYPHLYNVHVLRYDKRLQKKETGLTNTIRLVVHFNIIDFSQKYFC